MENMQTTGRKIPWLAIIIVIIVILAVVQYITTKPKGENPAGTVEQYSTSTPPTDELPYSSGPAETSTSTTSTNTKNFMHTITLETNKGTIVFETYDADAPKTVENFITLANKNFYNGVIFHRVISGFMIQGGDPTGTGTGGPGYQFADELNPNTESYKAGYVRGTVAMANAGPNTNGSQFFIMHRDTPLPHAYTIFGKVVQGLDIVDAIAATPTNAQDRPLQDVVINKVTVASK